jgi:hypothetical protein
MDAFNTFKSIFFFSSADADDITIPSTPVDEDGGGSGGGTNYCVIA